MADYTIAVIDGDGFAKAAFMTSPQQMIHRFLGRVFKLNHDHPKTKIVVAWDREDSSDERLKVFPAYKANRRAGPNKFGIPYQTEVKLLKRILKALGISSVDSTGWEADDAIATIVKMSKGKALVLTRDRDLLQLVTRECHVLLRTGSEDELITITEASARVGVPIGLYSYFKAIAGDTGDGVPGVPGVGPKGAQAVLKWNPKTLPEFSALGHVQGTPPAGVVKTVEKVVGCGREYIQTMMFLVKLHEVPLNIDKGNFNRSEIEQLFDQAQLRKLKKRLDEWSPKIRKRRIKRVIEKDFVDELSDKLGISFQKVESSNIWAAGTDEDDLLIIFKKRRVYRYPGASEFYGDLIRSDSIGSFFQEHIRPLRTSELDLLDLFPTLG